MTDRAVVVEARGVRKVYTLGSLQVEALRGVDLAVRRGEFVAIMGPSGSGKSTLLHLLGGLDRPTAGEVRIEGRSLGELEDEALTLLRRRRIGFVFQFFNLLPTLTAWENVALPLLLDGQDPGRHRDRIDRLLRQVGLWDRRDHRPEQLSGGQQQRVALARALVMEPALLLADEPTGNLDTRAGREVLELMRRTCEATGQTLVMVTHDPLAASYADRVIFLQDGRVAAELPRIRRGEVGEITRVLSELEA